MAIRVNNGFGIWSLVGAAPNSPTITNPDDSSALVTNLITGIYQFRWTVYSNYGVCPTQYSEVFDTVVISSNAGTDQNLCFQSTTSLLGPVGSSGTWTQTIGTSATVTTTSTNSAIVTNMSPSGSPYKFAYTVPTRWGCPQTTDTMTVVISDTTNVPNAGPDQSFCNATGFTLAGNNVSPNTAVWQQIFGTSTTITTPTSNTSTVTGLGYGIFLYRWTVTNGSCSRSDEVRITNNEAPTISNAGADTTICPSRVKMRANTAAVGVGNWRQVSGPSTAIIEEPVNPKTIISDLTSVGTYKFVWEISNGAVCPPSIDTIYVLVPFLNPTTAYAGLDSAICVRTATQLNGNSISIGTGNWSQYTVSPTSTISNASLNNSGLSLTTSGVYGYVWTATNGSCVSRDTVVYTLSDLPITSNAGPKINSCIGQPVILAANNASPNIGTWRQISGPFTVGFSDSNSRNSSVLGIDTGTYILRWQITSGSCPASNSFDTIVIVKLPAIAIAGGFQSLCGSSTTLTGSVDSIGTGLWSFVNGPNTPTIVSPTTETTAITGLTNGNYRFRWAITNGGCVSQDTVLITYVMPMINNACSSADSIYANGGLNSGIDSLCASTAEVGEPATCGKPACNSNMYKFVTNNTLWWQTVTFNFTISGNPCPGGLRVSCFNSGACPGLGSQMGTCQALSGSGGTVSFLLAPNTLYYLVVDDNSASCGTSNCRYSFTAAGNALPINYFEINASLINNNLSKIEWQVIEDDKNINYTLERKLEQENVFKTIAKIKSNGVIGIMENYNYLDNISSFNNTPIYYRIKYENEKNDIKYSKTVKLQKNIGGINSISIFPNPSTSIFNLNINVNEESTIKYTISNAVGKVIQSNTLELNNGLNTQLINLSSYDKGIYFVTIENEFVKNTIKIMLIE
jgi:hypothetical protein